MNRFTLIITFSCLFLVACERDRTEEINAEIQNRVARYAKQYTADCTQSTLDEAEKIVDSLMLEEARAAINDSLRNKAAARPAPPARLSPIDSAVVKPLFDQ